MPPKKPHILLMGQTPPPWHGQAVATQILFDHDWPEFEVHRLRMEFSEEMQEVGRFQWKKIRHLCHLIVKARTILKENPECILFYPPASAKWIPFLRDVVFLTSVRYLSGSTIFIFHASGLPEFVNAGLARRLMGRAAYQHADVSLEVAQEVVTPHDVFAAKDWQWCPCAIEVPESIYQASPIQSPMTVLFVGSLQEGKGVVEIFKTASLLKQQGREQDFRFRIVGKWFSKEFEDEVHHLRKELALGEMVELTGQLTGDDKWRAYADADVFFFPTHYASEATPIVLMEALGMGLPVVSTQWAGIPAMLEGCKTAWIEPIHSPTAYSKVLEELHSRRNELGEMHQASCEFYQKKFLPERFIERVESAFLQAVCGRTRDLGGSRAVIGESGSSADLQSSTLIPSPDPSISRIHLTAYLADQNPGYDRSFGISRMSQIVLDSLQKSGKVDVQAITSQSSQKSPSGTLNPYALPWGTRNKTIRLLTDHFHPLFFPHAENSNIYYYPKGYLPLISILCRPSVVTIHDTIIQYDEDHYPNWRKPSEYRYWAMMLKHTLRNADRILTVSESSKEQIEDFMKRHRIPSKNITVTYEPCLYENIPQPVDPTKENYVIHLASCEPHKRTAHLIRWWHMAEAKGQNVPMLHLIGNVPPEVAHLLASSHTIVKSPFLEESTLQATYRSARALILPSEIEGFGLPALESYYLGTPVCFIKGTSVEEILSGATEKGGFSLEHFESLFDALDEMIHMSPQEIYRIGLNLRETYASQKVAERMVTVFDEVRNQPSRT